MHVQNYIFTFMPVLTACNGPGPFCVAESFFSCNICQPSIPVVLSHLRSGAMAFANSHRGQPFCIAYFSNALMSLSPVSLVSSHCASQGGLRRGKIVVVAIMWSAPKWQHGRPQAMSLVSLESSIYILHQYGTL